MAALVELLCAAISTTASVMGFCLIMEDKNALDSTAAYAAVLAVFAETGTSSTTVTTWQCMWYEPY